MAYCELEGLEMPSAEELSEHAPDAAAWLDTLGWDRMTWELLRGMDKSQILPVRGRDELSVSNEITDRTSLVL
jgi:hypothetical protein